jgi:hypothetical protein
LRRKDTKKILYPQGKPRFFLPLFVHYIQKNRLILVDESAKSWL